jgi:excinuclease ABC subunit C
MPPAAVEQGPRWPGGARRHPGGHAANVARADRRPQPKFLGCARYFGPYLGGTKVRLAVSALRRLLPVAYASDRLRGSGRDMARVLGVGEGDREGLLATLVAVLERDRVAVQAVQTEFERRRDEAAQALAFERAATIQAAITAIEWVVAEQKVAMLEPEKTDVHGWADGMLVSFEIRAARLCRWHQRECSEERARPKVVATPARYGDFAHRTAVLAARLRAAAGSCDQAFCNAPTTAPGRSGGPEPR